MPKTINGVGTHYWGSANRVSRRDTCQLCQTEADLRSYDTTKYFVLFFIPILPLGKLRIIDDCSNCRMHGAIPLGEFEAAHLAEHGRPRETGGADWSGWLARTIWPLLVGGTLFAIWFGGTGLDVYFVNGLDRPYTVTVNGEAMELVPGEHPSRTLRSGKTYEVVMAEGQEDLPALEPLAVEIDLPFWDALTGDHVAVVNPDGLAHVAISETLYAVDQSLLDEDDSSFQLHAGETYYEFADVDYAFEDFPDEISMPSGKDTAWRTQVDLVEVPRFFAYNILLGAGDPQVASAYAERLMELGVDDPNLPQILSQAVDGDRFAELARTRLDTRPFEVEWHRSYQGLRESEGTHEAVVVEYRELLETLPDDAAAHYLLARLLKDGNESRQLLERALELDPPSPWAFYGLAFQEMTMGRWQRASELVDRALELGLDEGYHQVVKGPATLGARRYDELLEANRQFQAEWDEPDADLIGEEIRLLLAAGRAEQAEERRKEAVVAVTEAGYGEQSVRSLSAFWDGQMALGSGDLGTYGAKLADYHDDDTDYHRALLKQDWQAVVPALEAKIDEDAYDHILVALLAGEGAPEVRDRHLDAAREWLSDQSWDTRYLASALAATSGAATSGAGTSETGTDDLDLEMLRSLSLEPEDKAVALTYLATALGSRGPALAELASRLNIGIGLERHLIERELAAARSGRR